VGLRVALEADGFALLGEHVLTAPALLRSEVASVLHEALWRGEISRELAETARDRVLDADVELAADLHLEAWEVSQQLGWAKTYAAEYVALARRLRVPLLTADPRLARGARRLVEVLTPAELLGQGRFRRLPGSSSPSCW